VLRAELHGAVKALDERITSLEGRVSAAESVAAVAPESGAPVPVLAFDHESMQARMDEVEKTLARLRKKALPKRATSKE
jgi:hypothetical protein